MRREIKFSWLEETKFQTYQNCGYVSPLKGYEREWNTLLESSLGFAAGFMILLSGST